MGNYYYMEKKILAQLSKNIFDLLKEHNFSIIRYFQKDLGRYLLMLKIMESHYTDYSMSQERILESIPSSITSRSSLLSAINFAITKNYLEKKTDPKNKRAKHIVPTELLIIEFKHWMKIIHNQ